MKQLVYVSITLVLLLTLVYAGYEDEEFHSDIQDNQNILKEEHIDYYTEPKYSFNYAVHDPHTGDEKQHVEEREGDVVQGTYSLKEPDGTTRIVQYQADKHNGFNAQVHRIGISDHSQYKH